MGAATAIGVGMAVTAGAGMLQGDAARKAAGAQQDAAEGWNSYVSGQRARAEQAYNEYAPAQQAAIDKSIHGQEANIARQEKLVQSIDPALISAGGQMKQLLEGQSAPVLQNIKDQRQLQRQTLLDSLRQQLGPGGETSQMGMNALRKFDADTSNQLSGAQQSYLSQVSNLALGGAQNLGQSLGAEYGRQVDFGNAMGKIGLNKADIITGSLGAQGQAQQAVTQAAGGQYAGQQILGQTLGNIGGGLAQYGAYSAGGQNQTQDVRPTRNPGSDTIGSSGGFAQFQMPTLGGSVYRPVGTYGG